MDLVLGTCPSAHDAFASAGQPPQRPAALVGRPDLFEQSGNQQPLSWNQQGPQGPPGPTGPAGPPGESSIRDYEWLFANSPLDSTSPKAHIVSCPYPKRAVGGGGLAVGLGGVAVPGVAVFASYPAANGGPSNAWEVRAQETVPTDTGWRIHAHVVCANVS